MIPRAYRALLDDRRTRRLLIGMGVSSLGDGMSLVTVAWLAVRLAPPREVGLFVGAAVAAYTLPGAIGALLFRKALRGRSARLLVLVNCLLRAGLLGTAAVLSLLGDLAPDIYVLLLAESSLMSAWGNAGQYTMLSALGGPNGRLAANSLGSAQASGAVIVGPAIAGLLLARVGPAWLIALDAASFAYLGIQAWRIPPAAIATGDAVAVRAAESGFRLLRRRGLVSLIALTWLFFFLYGPVEDALPVYVARDAHAHTSLLGVSWGAYGVGALISSLITGTSRVRDNRTIILLIVAGWGACLIPFTFAPVPVTVACLAFGGLIYGPFIPLTYAIFQSATTTENLPSLLAARSALTVVATPLGTVVGAPLVGAAGAAATLTASGAATILLAAGTAVLWRSHLRPGQLLPARWNTNPG
jgi:predicted MFS family arabinose efflux permease